MGAEVTNVKEVRLNPPDPLQTTSGPTCVIVTTNAPLAPVDPVDPTYEVQYPLAFNQVFAADPEAKGPPPEGPATAFAILMNEGSVRAEDLKNPTEAETPDTGVGWVLLGTDWAMTYPRSSSGPFHH
jgi:hypothetical protein